MLSGDICLPQVHEHAMRFRDDSCQALQPSRADPSTIFERVWFPALCGAYLLARAQLLARERAEDLQAQVVVDDPEEGN